ncbi:MAG: bifunctional hydroxymethylpyrimidine kinase/phosphomethylpyrimidine kinase [Gammaproteobacteria bacterium]|nr:bifunctional hydroxymethylpyrimidine kinase/phosphomethylpyrimidine kinase [Gammaproteobacteria bacterium]
MTPPSVVLTIGGFDGSGGAGTLADARAIQLNGGYSCAIVTAITAQNTTSVDHIEPVSPALIRRQLQCVVEDFQIDAIKIGMLPTVECVDTLTRYLGAGGFRCPVVVDPVMCATSGGQLINDDVLGALIDRLVPLTTLITPNVAEAGELTNRLIKTIEQAVEAGRQLVRMGCKHVLVKGGHLDVDRGTDVWCHEDGFETFEPTEVQDGTVRGTGCMLSSAIACYLAQGRPMREAILSSKAFVNRAIANRHSLGKGTALTAVGIQVPRA